VAQCSAIANKYSEVKPTMSDTTSLPVYGARARIGLLVPSPNTVAETEFWRIAPPGVSIHTSRMPFFADDGADAFKKMEEQVPRVMAEAITAQPSVIAYGCTASSAVGDPAAKERKLSDLAGLTTVTAAAALLAALRTFKAKKIALVTPYPQAINDKERKFFAQNGVEVICDESLIVDPGQQQLRNMFKVPTALLIERAVALGSNPDVEAIVLSCCDMPTLDAIEQIEVRTGKPVTTSTQALLWRSLRAAGIDDAVQNCGRLLMSD
jgi:maleate cis-trans isomerase